MSDFGEKVGKGILLGMLAIAIPFIWIANKVAEGLESMGVDNPPHDPDDDYRDNPYHP